MMLNLKSKLLIYLFLIVILNSCDTENRIRVVRLGWNNDVYLKNTNKNWSKMPPPPPPIPQDILEFNFFQLDSNDIYFYALAHKEPICGTPWADRNEVPEINLSELMDYDVIDMKKVSESNIDSLFEFILKRDSSTIKSVALGILNDSSRDNLILNITERLVANTYKIDWKVRKTHRHELEKFALK